jgi:hypothetical protein
VPLAASIPAVGGVQLIASAGADQVPTDLSVVTLDGSGSSGQDSLSWTLTRYNGVGVSSDQTGLLSSTTAESPTFTPEDYDYIYVATVTVVAAGKTNESDSSAVFVVPYATVDFSAATKIDLNSMEGAGTALGLSSDFDLNQVEGELDSGNDPLQYTFVMKSGITWTDYSAIQMICTTTTPLNSGSSAKGRINLGITSVDGTVVTNKCYVGSLVINTSDDAGRTHARRALSNPSAGATPALSSGVSTMEVMVQLEGDLIERLTIVNFDDSGNFGQASVATGLSSDPYTDAIGILAFEREPGTISANISFDDTVVKYRLIPSLP